MANMPSSRRSRIGLYRSEITPPDRLEKTTIGREEILRDLLEKLERSTGKKTHQHYIFIGPRGVGKTHLLSLLVYRIESSPKICDRFTIVRFSEETHRLLSYADFLLRTCEILAKGKGHEDWKALYDSLAESEDDQYIIDSLEPRLNQYKKDTAHILLLLLENLDEVLVRQIKQKQDVHRLRRFLMTSPSCILVATAPILFPGLTDVKEPFYDFFDIQVLDNLTQQQTLNAIKANLTYDKHADLLARFEELSPKIKALHQMTGGNPRLVQMHYALIADEDVLDVKHQFEQLLDQISPFYQDRIKDLPPQERAVLETMALIRTQPKTPALIARKLRKSQQQTSSLLKRLTQSGYLVVMDHPSDKRSKIYRIKEGFFDIWLSMNESRSQRKRLPALTEFFELWYQREEREQKRRLLVDQLLAGEATPQDIDRNVAILDILSDAGKDEEKIAAKLQIASVLKKSGRSDDLAIYLDEIETLKPVGVVQWLTSHREIWADDSQLTDPIRQVEDMIACWELQRSGQLEEFSQRLLNIGQSLQGVGLHQALIDLLLSSTEALKEPEAKFHFLMQAAWSQKEIGELPKAINTLQNCLQLSRQSQNQQLEGRALNNISQIYHDQGDNDTALEYLNQSLQVRRKIEDRSGEGTTLNNIGQIYKTRGDYDTALKYLNQSLKIYREIGDRSGEGLALNNISQIYYEQGDNDTALEYVNQSIQVRRKIEDRSGEGTTLNNIGQIYHDKGDYDTALKYLNQSLKIYREIGDRSNEGTTLNNIGQVYKARRDYDSALKYLNQSLKICREIGSRVGTSTILHNMAAIAFESKDIENYVELQVEAFSIAREIGDARSLYYTGLGMAGILIRADKKEEALKILHQCLEVGTKAGFPGLEELQDAIKQMESA